MMSSLDMLGYYGPAILLFANIWFLRHHEFHIFLFMIYVFIVILLTKQLKLWIRDPRPYGYNMEIYKEWVSFDYTGAEKYGMPSGHSTLVFFAIFYLWWMKQNVTYMIIGLFIAALTIYQRYAYKKHTIEQLVAGACLGIGLSILGYFSTEALFSLRNTSKSPNNV